MKRLASVTLDEVGCGFLFARADFCDQRWLLFGKARVGAECMHWIRIVVVAVFDASRKSGRHNQKCVKKRVFEVSALRLLSDMGRRTKSGLLRVTH